MSFAFPPFQANKHIPPSQSLTHSITTPLLSNSVRYLDDEQHEAVVDWEDPQAARALTTTLLRHDFGLAWDIPLERLCPPVPNRLNYVCWVRDLLLLGKGEAGLDDATGGWVGGCECWCAGIIHRPTNQLIN